MAQPGCGKGHGVGHGRPGSALPPRAHLWSGLGPLQPWCSHGPIAALTIAALALSTQGTHGPMDPWTHGPIAALALSTQGSTRVLPSLPCLRSLSSPSFNCSSGLQIPARCPLERNSA